MTGDLAAAGGGVRDRGRLRGGGGGARRRPRGPRHHPVGQRTRDQREFVEKKKVGWLRTRRRTRRTGSFEFRTLLARDVDADKITAALADGVLTVTIPKTASARSRRIEVTTD
ncbi:small heat shock protein [Rhodococcus wratislaviensis]|uniref:Small heat shock protein n=1 Tax=Rhodococcus wratislaviensis TaxID=44752 RepID=A0A402CJH1_RHOWR|nr:small heat shock protein [Rhodococcus wratislaviensis]